jgi:hypothetical protein
MKLLLSTLLLILSVTVFAQSNAFAGDYNRTINSEVNDTFDYKLTLNPDGTFLFHYCSKIKNGIPPEVNKYGKGKWTAKDNVLTFSSNKQEDFDSKYPALRSVNKSQLQNIIVIALRSLPTS